MSSPLTGATAPADTFAQLGIAAELVKQLALRDIISPLPIQSMTIPDALAGRDVCGKAPTGSGKTLAFTLPMATTLNRAKPHRPRGLILAPTRELAAQITAELGPQLALRKLRAHPFYGGVKFGSQLTALRRGVDAVVACPGRLTDLMRGGHVDLGDVDFVVIDEADRMADMGFLPDVRRILDATSQVRQTLLFSATLDGDVDVLVRRYQTDPARHEVESDEIDVSRVSHQFHAVDPTLRTDLCAGLVDGAGPTVVFVRTRHGAERLSRQLVRSGIDTAAIHGDLSQGQRDRALSSFKNGKVGVLVATDVAARGIHVDDVACVLHFDLPSNAKDYVHRSGRTARAGASGSVIAFVAPDQQREARAILATLDIEAELIGQWAPPGRSAAVSSPSRSNGRPGGQGAHRPRGSRSPASRRPSSRGPRRTRRAA